MRNRLTGVLVEDLDFEGPIAGKRKGAAGFIGGLKRFVEGLQAPIHIHQNTRFRRSGQPCSTTAALPERDHAFLPNSSAWRMDGIQSIKLSVRRRAVPGFGGVGKADPSTRSRSISALPSQSSYRGRRPNLDRGQASSTGRSR